MVAGIDADAAADLARPHPIEAPTGTGVYRAEPSAQELFAAAGALARVARQRLRGAHVVLAAVDLERGTLARVLDRLGVDRAQLNDAAREQLS